MTANAMAGDRDRCIAAGMNDHIAKPIEPEDLWKVLLKWIRPRQTPQGMAPARGASPGPGLALPAIDGLDMVAALRRVLGKSPLYLSMLRKFKTGQRGAPLGIRKALEAGDWPTAERIAHTLKGVSGNIGASRLQLLAESLETALNEGRSRELVDERLGDLEGPLETLIAQLERQLPVEPIPESMPVDSGELQAVCGRLRALLADDDGEAGDLLEANAGLLSAAFPKEFRALEEIIQSCDFEAALAKLESLLGGTP
jgi:HPt (histidine-containing phosphotransfer) domain-containing protein